MLILTGLLFSVVACGAGNNQPNRTQNSANRNTVSKTNKFDFQKKTVKLNDGREMPILGIGVFSLTPEQAENSVYHALLDGYRLID